MALACLKFVLFHPLQELSVQLFAQLEKDTKGTEEEADGKGWYRFSCLHKVCFRNLVSVARYLAFLVIEVRTGGRGFGEVDCSSPSLRNFLNLLGKTLMSRAKVLERKHSKR